MEIPRGVDEILARLRESGYKAYPVGGCVRDTLLGLNPHDWDITTSAPPLKVMEVLGDKKIIPTGIAHGTVTVISGGSPVEVTTFRSDWGYGDKRHPDAVHFESNLAEDLRRRDFTINAMCIDEDGSLIDMFKGEEDVKNHILRTIGDPDKRFNEDALRILRALRFSAVYNLKIEENTGLSLLKNREKLSFVSKERTMRELIKIIKAPYCEKVMLDYKSVIFEVIPELSHCDGVFQRQDYHCYDVWEHIVHSVGAIEPKTHLRLTMLLHDVGKPLCSDGRGHFKGHAYKSADMAFDILKRMNTSAKLREKVVRLVRLHNTVVENSDEAVRRLLYKVGGEAALDLVKVFKADNMAKRSEIASARNKYYTEIEEKLDIIIGENLPFTVKNLKISGQDIIGMGVSAGPLVGTILKALNRMVAENLVKNEKAKLFAAAEKIILENHIKTGK